MRLGWCGGGPSAATASSLPRPTSSGGRIGRVSSKNRTYLEKYIYLSQLQDTDETLFFCVLTSDPVQFLPLVYTPTVGEACLQFGHIMRRPKGLYLSIKRKGRVREI